MKTLEGYHRQAPDPSRGHAVPQCPHVRYSGPRAQKETFQSVQRVGHSDG